MSTGQQAKTCGTLVRRVPRFAQSLTTHASTQPAVGAAKHHSQNAYLTAMFGQYIEGYFNNLIRLQSQTEFTTKHWKQHGIPWLDTPVCLACTNRSQSLKLAHFWSDISWFPPLLFRYIPLHDLKRAGENSANFSARRSQSGGIPGTWLLR